MKSTIQGSSPHEHLKEVIQAVEQESWLNLKRMFSWRWSTGGCGHDSSDYTEKSFCILLRQKIMQDTKNELFFHLLRSEMRVSQTTGLYKEEYIMGHTMIF